MGPDYKRVLVILDVVVTSAAANGLQMDLQVKNNGVEQKGTTLSQAHNPPDDRLYSAPSISYHETLGVVEHGLDKDPVVLAPGHETTSIPKPEYQDVASVQNPGYHEMLSVHHPANHRPGYHSMPDASAHNPGYHDMTGAHNPGYHDMTGVHNPRYHETLGVHNPKYHETLGVPNPGYHEMTGLHNPGYHEITGVHNPEYHDMS
uniref:Uncharacterized protein n=1 Tax=Timema bartmani TaxID=61472 RepID=A0A7R9F8N9_9NEOP|nr:unnamed protein product [Timema bartmani]